ncbi:MAG: hypothetical protein CR979_02575 [Propionibacterium sp.]|nr:MAG: hypothetical protein CR979_02575 [Propionibacterium sp.]
MTRNTVAVISAVLFLIFSTLLLAMPVPYVTRAPGETYNVLGSKDGQPVLRVEGINTYPTTGKILLTTISQSGPETQINLIDALIASLSTTKQVLPREWIYQTGKTNEQLQIKADNQLKQAQDMAAVAALRAAGNPVDELPVVASINTGGPAFGILEVGDFVTKIDDDSVWSVSQVTEAIQHKAVGDQLLIEVKRGKDVRNLQVTTISSNQNKKVPTIGVSYETGYRYGPQISYVGDSAVFGAGEGLAFALGIYDQITASDIVGDSVVAVAGGVDSDGTVRPTESVRQKVAGAQHAGANVFLIPAENCEDIVGMSFDMQIVKITNLGEAIEVLRELAATETITKAPSC